MNSENSNATLKENLPINPGGMLFLVIVAGRASMKLERVKIPKRKRKKEEEEEKTRNSEN